MASKKTTTFNLIFTTNLKTNLKRKSGALKQTTIF